MIKVNGKVLQNTIDTHGVNNTLSICMEEPAELIQAISKILRGWTDCKNPEFVIPNEYRDNLVEEMADTLIIIGELKLIFNVSEDELSTWIKQKQDRQIKRDELPDAMGDTEGSGYEV